MDVENRQPPLLLCVDDEKPGLTLRKQVLEHNGFRVLVAEDSVQALELFRRHPVSLVMADHLLGSESGVRLAADFKRLKPWIPVVLLSGMPPESMENIDCFISKGEEPRFILSLIRDLLRR